METIFCGRYCLVNGHQLGKGARQPRRVGDLWRRMVSIGMLVALPAVTSVGYSGEMNETPSDSFGDRLQPRMGIELPHHRLKVVPHGVHAQ